MKKLVEIHIFDPVAHSLYIVHQESSDSLNTVSKSAAADYSPKPSGAGNSDRLQLCVDGALADGLEGHFPENNILPVGNTRLQVPGISIIQGVAEVEPAGGPLRAEEVREDTIPGAEVEYCRVNIEEDLIENESKVAQAVQDTD